MVTCITLERREKLNALSGKNRDSDFNNTVGGTLISYQYSETNVMQFLFNLLRINGLYMFRALLAHPQEGLHKRHMVYCLRVMSVGCTRIGVELVQPTDITRTQYTKCRL
jgi:hypothetical protein